MQHALRAFTPIEQKAVRAAAETFRANPKFKTEKAITELGVGEALVSMLEPGGTPSVVDRAKICPPRSRMGAITPDERKHVQDLSPLAGKYDETVDRESAYELLQGRATTVAAEPEPSSPWGTAPAPASSSDPWGGTARSLGAAHRRRCHARAGGRTASPADSPACRGCSFEWGPSL